MKKQANRLKPRDYKCHMCGQTFYGHPATQLTLIGFNWHPAGLGENTPGWLYDLCPICKHEFCKMYLSAREKRVREIESQNDELFKSGLLSIGDENRTSSIGSMSDAHSPTLNYARSEHKHPARLYRSTEKQHTWRF